MLRAGSTIWPEPLAAFPWLETTLLVGAAAAFGATRIRLVSSSALGLAFVAVTMLNGAVMIRNGLLPSASLQLACWFALGTVHAVHVFGGAVFSGWLAGPAFPLRQGYGGQIGMADNDPERWNARIEATRRYWIFVVLVWLLLVGSFYVL